MRHMPATSASTAVAQAHDMGAEILADLQRMVEQGAAPKPAVVEEGTDIVERKKLAEQTIALYREIIERYEAQARAMTSTPAGAEMDSSQESIEEKEAAIRAKYGL
jgi:hypothetical protein